MEEQALRAAVDEVAALLSELTVGDLGLSNGPGMGDVGDLYLRILADLDLVVERLGRVPTRGELRREDLSGLADLHGGGYDRPYRTRSAVALAALGDSSAGVDLREGFAHTCGAHIDRLRLCLGID